MIGTFGEDIVFAVGGGQALTFDGLSRRSPASFARHARAGAKPVLEFTGPDLSEIGFTMHLSLSLGVDPKTTIDRLMALKDAGEEKQLIIGGSLIGAYVITEIADTWAAVSGHGIVTEATVAVTLLEAVQS